MTSREVSLLNNSVNDPYQHLYVSGGNHPLTSRFA